MTLAEVLHTAAEQFNPDDGIDLVGMLIAGLPASLPAIAALIVVIRGQRRGVRRWKGDRQLLNDVHRQTVNDHPEEENMREQLDRIERKQNALHGDVSEMRKRQIDQGRDIGGIRTDVGELRGADRDAARNQREFEQRVQAAFRREHPGSPPL